MNTLNDILYVATVWNQSRKEKRKWSDNRLKEEDKRWREGGAGRMGDEGREREREGETEVIIID